GPAQQAGTRPSTPGVFVPNIFGPCNPARAGVPSAAPQAREERRDLAVLHLVLLRRGAGAREVAQGALRVDAHVARARDLARGLHRLVFRIEEVGRAREDQRLRADRAQRAVVVAVEARRVADVVLVVRPALVDPVERVHPLPAAVLDAFQELELVLAALR